MSPHNCSRGGSFQKSGKIEGARADFRAGDLPFERLCLMVACDVQFLVQVVQRLLNGVDGLLLRVDLVFFILQRSCVRL